MNFLICCSRGNLIRGLVIPVLLFRRTCASFFVRDRPTSPETGFWCWSRPKPKGVAGRPKSSKMTGQTFENLQFAPKCLMLSRCQEIDFQKIKRGSSSLYPVCGPIAEIPPDFGHFYCIHLATLSSFASFIPLVAIFPAHLTADL